MPAILHKSIPNPAALAVRRTSSLFYPDIEKNIDNLKSEITGKRILVIGGAGSIGSSTIHTISLFSPRALHVVDQNENGLAELVRGLRSRGAGLSIDEFQCLPLNYGNAPFYQFLEHNRHYDVVLNFAALKHVRSEKDSFSIMEMLNTNLLLMANLLEALSKKHTPGRFFSVSTDKAANPASMMGASKRVMEHFLFDKSLPRPMYMDITSARFANVAYSNGSLLQSFDSRFGARQPLVAPKNCKRYFVSIEESGHICTLAALLPPSDTIAVPNLNPEDHLILLEDVLFDYLEFKGLKPRVFENERLAREAVDACERAGEWPVLLPALDTVGEKPYEEFASNREEVFDIGMEQLSGVGYLPPEAGSVIELRDHLNKIIHGAEGGQRSLIDKSLFKDLISSLEPSFLNTHKESTSNLDQRM